MRKAHGQHVGGGRRGALPVPLNPALLLVQKAASTAGVTYGTGPIALFLGLGVVLPCLSPAPQQCTCSRRGFHCCLRAPPPILLHPSPAPLPSWEPHKQINVHVPRCLGKKK